ncbi:ion channel [Crepidotus variabilis]|uniref:Ion channel n=1 Tax=Crepidotus variabilis TaxID=179855 RepID=A0A9P6JKJ8_9AGAR|nr:ion channel [Crepidotus variabilis]
MADQRQPSRWNSAEARTHLMNAETMVSNRVKGIWSGFLDFALRDNVLEVAVGLIVASTFTAVVNSLVSDILLPPLSLLPFMSKNIEEKFWILQRGIHGSQGYNTRKQAIDDGAVIMMYGQFINKIVDFICIGLSLYLIATLYGAFSHDSIIRHTIRCRYCRKEISEKAKRCPLCTTWMDGREDKETSALPHHD